MKERKKKLPVGIDSFEKIGAGDYYYIDKTDLIADLLCNGGEVTLFTRPRRFGKTLNMSMLSAFFSPETEKNIFDGLNISNETALCKEYMGKYPVIFLSLKDIDAGTYPTAFEFAVQIINEAAFKIYPALKDSERLLPEERTLAARYLRNDLSEAEAAASLRILSRLMEKHYGQKVIILIDEYDVPLAKAYDKGYYDPMVQLIRNLFHQALKTNDSLQLAVLTGCMRITKESIFTGLNNLEVHSISDEEYEEYFGFTDEEVREMLAYYELSDFYDTIRDWYNGYQFGETSVYCPWDVIRYVKKLCRNRNARPENYWLNSSDNSIVSKFVEYNGNTSVRAEIEDLINGNVIEKTIRTDLTYPDMYTSIDNLWSVLYTTGYLTRRGEADGDRLRLAIPNREVCNIFSENILELFRKNVRKDSETLRQLCDALQNRDVPSVERCMNNYLKRTISIRDTAVRNSLKENFYHGILLGILSAKSDWRVISNQESGNGYSDIQVTDSDNGLAIVIEVKYADHGNLEETCRRGLFQIEEKHYTDRFREEEYQTILRYGMAFFRKECRVMLAEDL